MKIFMGDKICQTSSNYTPKSPDKIYLSKKGSIILFLTTMFYLLTFQQA